MSIHEWNYNLQNEMLSTIKEWQNLAKKLELENTSLREAHNKVLMEFQKVDAENAILRDLLKSEAASKSKL
jgi:hypothetical protein